MNRIFELLNFRDDLILTSAIRFLRIGAGKFADKNLLTEKLLKIKSKSTNVNYEIINALALLSNKDTKIDVEYLKYFMNNKSWLVSRSTYQLIDKLENIALREEVIIRYKKTDEQFEKILFLNALKTDFDEKIFDFYKMELLNNNDILIRKNILRNLKYAKDKNSLLIWCNENYSVFSKNDIKELGESCSDDIYDDFSYNIMILLLNKGFDPYENVLSDDSTNLFFSLLDKMEDNKEKFNKMDKILLENKLLKEKWVKFKSKI